MRSTSRMSADSRPRLCCAVDAVVHLAAVSNDPMGHAYEDLTRQVNHVAAAAVARQAKAAGVRSFVFASSCSVYGAADDRPRTERSSLNPLTTYAKSKILAEQALCELAGPTFRISCLRFATACGMSDRLRLDLVLNDFVASAMSTGGITVLSDGTPWRPLINVADMARAIDWAVGRDADAGGDFLIVNAGSDGWNYQVSELAGPWRPRCQGPRCRSIGSPPRQAIVPRRFLALRLARAGHQPWRGLTDTVEAIATRAGVHGVQRPRFPQLIADSAACCWPRSAPGVSWSRWVDEGPSKEVEVLVCDPRPPAASRARLCRSRRQEDMIFLPRNLQGRSSSNQPHGDERGFFARAWCPREFEAHGLTPVSCRPICPPTGAAAPCAGFIISSRLPGGQARAMHPRGDLRRDRGSCPESSHLKWIGVELTADHRMLYVPEEFAHGFQSLVDDTEVFYQVSQFYTPEAERGIRWDDTTFGIQWPDVPTRIVSAKDEGWPPLETLAEIRP